MSRDEKISAVVLVLCLVLWVSESWHGISAAVVALIGMRILLSTNVMDRKSFRANIAWDATDIHLAGSTGSRHRVQQGRHHRVGQHLLRSLP